MAKWLRSGSKVKGLQAPTTGKTAACLGNGRKTGCSCTLNLVGSAGAAQPFSSKTMTPRYRRGQAGLALNETANSIPLPISRETVSPTLGAAKGPRRVRPTSLSGLRCKNCKEDC